VALRITIVGGGSYQWVPKLLVDIANTPSVRDIPLTATGGHPAVAPAVHLR